MKFSKRLLTVLAVSILSSLASLPLQATALSTLIPGGVITDGPITYSDFTFTRTCQPALTGLCAPLDASGLDVSLIAGGIQIAGGISVTSPTGTLVVGDFLIGFTYTGPSPVTDVGLAFNGSTQGNGSFAQVVESIIVNQTVEAQLEVNAPLGPWSTTLHLDDPLKSFDVIKDIQLGAFESNGFLALSTISFVHQYYFAPTIDPRCVGDQCPDVPEPSTFALIGLGLVGAGVFRLARHNDSVGR